MGAQFAQSGKHASLTIAERSKKLNMGLNESKVLSEVDSSLSSTQMMLTTEQDKQRLQSSTFTG